MICTAGPAAVRLQKALLRNWEELPLRDAVERGIDCLARGFASGEPRERMRAFLDPKRWLRFSRSSPRPESPRPSVGIRAVP